MIFFDEKLGQKVLRETRVISPSYDLANKISEFDRSKHDQERSQLEGLALEGRPGRSGVRIQPGSERGSFAEPRSFPSPWRAYLDSDLRLIVPSLGGQMARKHDEQRRQRRLAERQAKELAFSEQHAAIRAGAAVRLSEQGR